MIVLPTRGRPDSLQRFFDIGRPHLAGVVVLDEDDQHHYAAVRLPPNWRRLVFPRRPVAPLMNAVFEMNPNEPWYGLMGDDVVCETPDWDVVLSESCRRDFIAWGDDGIAGKPSHPFLHGDLVRAMGFVSPPGFRHLYTDTVIEHIATALRIGRYHPEVKTTHWHFSTGRSPMDATYRERPIAGDAERYDAFMRNEFSALVIRLERRLRPPRQ